LTSIWNYTVTHFDESNSWASTDITEDVVSIPTATDTGSGEVNSARIILSADTGKFISKIPYIDQYDRIRIQIDDGISATTNYDKYFDVIKILPSESKSQGTRIELFLMGLEHHLQKINYTKPHFSEGAFEVMKDIGDQYNISRGTQQPVLTGHDNTTKNKLPNSTFQKNNYTYGDNEAPCYDRMEEVTDSLGAAVDEGGALDFYDYKFDYTNHTTMDLKVFSSGNDISNPVEITNTTSVNVGETDAGVDNTTGSNVLAWGANEAGSLPVEFSRFNSGEIRYNLYPVYDSSLSYVEDQKILHNGNLYKSLQSVPSGNIPPGTTSSPSSNSYWQSRTKETEYGQYYISKWTNVNGHLIWKDSGIDPTDINSSSEIGPGFNDANIVVWDTSADANWFRSWADVRVTGTLAPSTITGDSTLKKYLYSNDTFYRGFRVLIQGTPSSGVWNGNDSNGKAYANALVECISAGNATDAVWRVKYLPTSNLQCIVRHEGIPYKYNGSAWVGGAASTEGDCLHPYDEITTTEGIYGTEFSSTVNNNSGIKVRYYWETIAGFVTNTTQQHSVGGWINLTFPFPHSIISQSAWATGQLYGGTKTSDAVCEPATLDIENMHLSPEGERGFNTIEAGGYSGSENLGPISSIDFAFKVHYQGSSLQNSGYDTLAEANFVMSCILVDSSDNMVKQDFIVPHNNQWLPYKLPVSGFTTYRGRKPRASIINSIIPPKEITINNQIEWRNIKQIIIQTAQSYDSDGRYVESSIEGNFYAQSNTAVEQLGIPAVPTIGRDHRRLDLYLDAFRFTKPLLVNTGKQSSRNIESDFIDKPEVYDYFQLKNIANAEKEKRQHRHVEFEVNTTGKFDINFGDFFEFYHPRLIPRAVRTNTSGDDYVKLVAKHIEYSITKPVDGKGGFLRKILGVRRFE
jgi:hypothetical protein